MVGSRSNTRWYLSRDTWVDGNIIVWQPGQMTSSTGYEPNFAARAVGNSTGLGRGSQAIAPYPNPTVPSSLAAGHRVPDGAPMALCPPDAVGDHAQGQQPSNALVPEIFEERRVVLAPSTPMGTRTSTRDSPEKAMLRQQLHDIQSTIPLLKQETRREAEDCLLYTSPSPRDQRGSRMPSSA